MTAIVNPWTNKTKTRGEGMLNAIMQKHLSYQSEEVEPRKSQISLKNQ